MENTEKVDQSYLLGNIINLTNDKIKSSGVVKTLDENSSLEELFESYIECGTKTFERDGKLKPAAFLIIRNLVTEKYSTAVYPMYNEKPGDMELHSQILRKLVKQMLVSGTPKATLVGIVIGMDAFMSIQDVKDIKDATAPSKDPKAKDVLHFTLETSFGKHMKVFEYIKSSDGAVVVNFTPIQDTKHPYNEIEDKGNFGFFMSQKVSQN